MHRLRRNFKDVTVSPVYFNELNGQFFSTSVSEESDVNQCDLQISYQKDPTTTHFQSCLDSVISVTVRCRAWNCLSSM